MKHNMTLIMIFILLFSFSIDAKTLKKRRKEKKTTTTTAVDTTKKVPPGPGNVLPEEEVKGKYTGKIKDEKPMAKLNFDIYSAVDALTGSGSYIFDPELAIRSDIASTPPPTLSSKQLRQPWLREIIKGRIAILHPQYVAENIESWELVISDPKGDIFKKFSGKGQPPASLDWDGRGDNGKMVDVGLTYSYSATAWDKVGNKASIVGEPLRFAGLLYQEGTTWVVSLNGWEVFPQGRVALLEEGLPLLQESIDLVRKKFNSNVNVKVYAEDEALAIGRASMVANYFTDRLILPTKALSYSAGFVGEGESKTSRVEIIIK